MKKLSFIVVAMFFLTFFSSFIVSAGDEADAFRAAVKNIFNTYRTANVNGDVDLYLSLWDDNGIKMSANRPAIYGKSAIGEMKRKSSQKWEYESQNIKIEETQVAGNWGFARGTFTSSLKSKVGGAKRFADGKFLTIFKRQSDGSWKIFRDSTSSNAPPK